MKKSASLPDDVKALLRQGYDRSVELNSNVFAQEIRNAARPHDAFTEWAESLREGSLKSVTSFQLSVRLLGVLEELRSEEETDTDPEGHVTALLTCEFHIYKLNCSTPLRYNPFLHHWVTTCAQIQQTLPEELVPWHWKARLEIVRLALTSPGVEDGLAERGSKNMEKRSPQSIAEKVQKESIQLIDLTPFVHMLAHQGLPITDDLKSYLVMEECRITPGQTRDKPAQDDVLRDLLKRATTSTHRNAGSISSQHSNGSHQLPPNLPAHEPFPPDESQFSDTHQHTSKGKDPIPQVFPITSRSSLADVQHALKIDPAEATHALTRLPIDLSSLELLTRLLLETSPSSGPISPDISATITREYIQHSLRIIERLGASTFSPSSPTDTGDAAIDATDGLPTGKDEQVRAVRLLVMFMKNLLRNGRLPVQELMFDLQEISTRYIWVAEVREFTKLLEGGDVVSLDGGLGQHHLHDVGG